MIGDVKDKMSKMPSVSDHRAICITKLKRKVSELS